jgi:hypothetical protein
MTIAKETKINTELDECEIKLNWRHQNLAADPIACLIVVALSLAAQ